VPQKKRCVVFLAQAETTVRDFVERILHEHGSIVCSASNALSALQFLRGYRDELHLVLVERHIPGMDGVELAELLAEARPQARVVLISDDGLVPKKWRHRLLIKPLEAAALRKQVEEALEALPCDTSPATATISSAIK
jgi:DNA-binding NtrC family response regulator